MKKGRFTAFLLLVVLTLTAALSGCAAGSKGTVTSANENNVSSAAVQNGNVNSAGASAQGEATYGGEISVGIAQDLDDSLDPHKMVAAGTKEVFFNVFEGLVKPDTDGNLIPAVASDYEVSEDGTQYTFTLREGITFHNGSPVTVNDIAYSIKRCAGLLDSGEEALDTALSVITSVETPDDTHVVITIPTADPDFMAGLTAAIIPEGYDKQRTAPIGTGPYKFVSRSAQENVVLEKFDGYWGEAPYLDKVTFKVVSADTVAMSLQSGAIDLMNHLDLNTAQQAGDSINIIAGESNLVQALYLNNSFGPFQDVRVRQALCYATNKDEVMELLNGGYGTKIGSSMFPTFGKYYVDLADAYPQDLQKARDLLAEAGYPDGFSFTIRVPSNYQPHIDTAQILVEQYAQIGVKASIELVDWETWKTDVYMGRQYEATVIGFDASTLTARALLERFTSASSKNISAFADAEYDTEYAKARASSDADEQIACYQRMQEILSEQAANVYIQDLPNLVCMSKKLGGLTFYPLYVLDISKIYYVA